MDKPRRPQVIRPWKIQQTQRTKFNSSATGDPRHPHESKIQLHWKKHKSLSM